MTLAILLLNLLFAVWLFSPVWADQRGVDARVFYAAGTLAGRGGNPYDPAQAAAEQDRLYNQPFGRHPGDPLYYSPSTYANPPLFTRLLELGAGLGSDGFYWLDFGITLVSGLAAMLLLLDMLEWRGRGIALAAFLLSPPFIVQAFLGNTSALLMLSWAGGAWLMHRRRPFLAGLVLSACLVKPSIGLLLVAGLLVLGPGRRATAAAGFVAGSAVLTLADVALTGWAPLREWFRALAGYGVALNPGQVHNQFSGNVTGLASFTSLLLDFLPAAAAIAISAIVIGGLFALAGSRRGWHRPPAEEGWLLLALGLAGLMAFSPYLHLNDLVLDSFAVLVLASRPLSAVTGAGLLGWYLLVGGRVFVLAIVSSVTHVPADAPAPAAAGVGAWLTSLLFAALVFSALTTRATAEEARV